METWSTALRCHSALKNIVKSFAGGDTEGCSSILFHSNLTLDFLCFPSLCHSVPCCTTDVRVCVLMCVLSYVTTADSSAVAVGALVTLLCLLSVGLIVCLKRKALVQMLCINKKSAIQKLRCGFLQRCLPQCVWSWMLVSIWGHQEKPCFKFKFQVQYKFISSISSYLGHNIIWNRK